MLTATAAAALVALIVVPWRSGVEAPALLKSEQHIDVFATESGARVAAIKVADGQSEGALPIGWFHPISTTKSRTPAPTSTSWNGR
jgi:hypothetical protein